MGFMEPYLKCSGSWLFLEVHCIAVRVDKQNAPGFFARGPENFNLPHFARGVPDDICVLWSGGVTGLCLSRLSVVDRKAESPPLIFVGLIGLAVVLGG